MKSRAVSGFWTRYEQLPSEIQKLARKNFRLWQANPSHPSLRFKPIRGELWSARVGAHYRALAIMKGNTATWIWIGSHEDYNRLV